MWPHLRSIWSASNIRNWLLLLQVGPQDAVHGCQDDLQQGPPQHYHALLLQLWQVPAMAETAQGADGQHFDRSHFLASTYGWKAECRSHCQ
jgi:hypothetical protein